MDERPFCYVCRRPMQVCICSALRPVQNRTPVVFIQHPRESRMPVSTCRLAHLSLPNSEMYVAMGPEENPALAERLRQPGTMVLFPGSAAVDVRQLPSPPQTLVVVDGTWNNARKLVERSPLLSSLPRVAFTPEKESNYRIRREPSAECLSTIEAVVFMLEVLEGAPGTFVPMLRAFDRMVDLQLEYINANFGKGGRKANKSGPSAPEKLLAVKDRLVLVFADGNAIPGRKTELAHVLAMRWSDRARFECLLLPRNTAPFLKPRGYGDYATMMARGETIEHAHARWKQFLKPSDIIASWGQFATRALEEDGFELGPVIDYKAEVSNWIHLRAGGVEQLAERMGATLPVRQGGAARKLAAMELVLQQMSTGRPGLLTTSRAYTPDLQHSLQPDGSDGHTHSTNDPKPASA